jgi:CRP-like cAMP-binding protein
VQNEVLVAAGTKPEDLCFIVDGQAAVAVRSAPGSSLLKDVALLHAGDTFGELCLLVGGLCKW